MKHQRFNFKLCGRWKAFLQRTKWTYPTIAVSLLSYLKRQNLTCLNIFLKVPKLYKTKNKTVEIGINYKVPTVLK